MAWRCKQRWPSLLALAAVPGGLVANNQSIFVKTFPKKIYIKMTTSNSQTAQQFPHWLNDGVILYSFLLHATLFLILYSKKNDVRAGCTQVSLFHHTIAFFVGLYCSYLYFEDILNFPTLEKNQLFPWAEWLTRFNAGYFFYDSIHVVIWDRVYEFFGFWIL